MAVSRKKAAPKKAARKRAKPTAGERLVKSAKAARKPAKPKAALVIRVPRRRPNAFDAWLGQAAAGAEWVFHAGHTVIMDAETETRFPDAQRAYEAYEAGVITIVQRRIPNSDGIFLYTAQKQR
jgi:hypothetical protein